MKSEDWLYDAGYACGWLHSENGIITDGAPIFKRILGKKLSDLKYGKLYKLKEEICAKNMILAKV